MRALTAAVASGLATALGPIALGSWVFFQGPGVDARGYPDDAPYRAAGLLLMLSPVFVVLAAVWFWVLSAVLSRLGRLRLRSLMTAAVCLGLAAAGFGIQAERVEDDTVRQTVAVSAFFGACIAGCFAFGGFVWWMARPRA